VDGAHILHTGTGSFDVYHTRIQDMGRSTTDQFNSTILEDSGLQLADGLAKMDVSKDGSNQIARYALHAHIVLFPWNSRAT